jgi:DNA invertase Pin-like site-specific DNA recombinase
MTRGNKQKEMNVAIYGRVSTVGKGQDVDMQLRDLRAYATSRGLSIFKEYIDDGISGRKDKRPALDALMNDARKRRFDAVLVWRFDRFARSTKHLVTALEDFRHLGINFISFQENIDTSSPMGKAMFTIVSAIAELEADIIRERVIAGIANARAKGVRLGRPSPDVDQGQVQRLRDSGLTIRAIADKLNLKRSFVHKTLSNHPPFSPEISGSETMKMAVQ